MKFSNRKQVEQEAAEWLVRLDSDESLTQVEKEEFDLWLSNDPQNYEVFSELAAMWNNANVLSQLAVPIAPKLSEKINSSITRYFRTSFVIAAAVFVSICLSLIYFYQPNLSTSTNGIMTTDIGEQQRVTLSDGSVVNINTNTSIDVKFSRQAREIILLKGEAHFNVAKDEDWPFRVVTGSSQISALGTVFNVRVNDNTTDVVVAEGRVGVASINQRQSGKPTKTNTITLGLLRAGEKASIVSKPDNDRALTSTLELFEKLDSASIQRSLSWTQGSLVFAGETLAEVVQEISRYTPITIEFSDPEIGAIRIGGRFPVGKTEAMFAALETDFGLHVSQVEDGRVFISNQP